MDEVYLIVERLCDEIRTKEMTGSRELIWEG
jgi:hypothetical protein